MTIEKICFGCQGEVTRVKFQKIDRLLPLDVMNVYTKLIKVRPVELTLSRGQGYTTTRCP